MYILSDSTKTLFYKLTLFNEKHTCCFFGNQKLLGNIVNLSDFPNPKKKGGVKLLDWYDSLYI